MKALFLKAFVISGLIFSISAKATPLEQCMLKIDVAGWANLEAALMIASGGYAITSDSSKAQYTAMIDEVEGNVPKCLYGCDEKQDILMILSILDKEGDLIYTDNKIAKEVKASEHQKTKVALLKSIPECEVLRFGTNF